MNRPARHGKRRGAVAPLTALLLIPILGMVFFSVDIGYIALTSMELQNAADAAALAAAEQLQPYYVQYYSPRPTSRPSCPTPRPRPRSSPRIMPRSTGRATPSASPWTRPTTWSLAIRIPAPPSSLRPPAAPSPTPSR